MIKLTFDTNVLIDYLFPAREHHQSANALVCKDQQNVCEIRVVSRLSEDVPGGDWAHLLKDLPISQRPRIGTISRWNVSAWGADFWSAQEDDDEIRQIFDLIFPYAKRDDKKQASRIADVDHLFGHMKAGRDIFVTRDGPVLDLQEILRSKFGIVVMHSTDAVRHLNRI